MSPVIGKTKNAFDHIYLSHETIVFVVLIHFVILVFNRMIIFISVSIVSSVGPIDLVLACAMRMSIGFNARISVDDLIILEK